MQITPSNQDNTNFKALHVSKESLKAMRTTRRQLLKNPIIKEASDRFEVLVKPSRNKYTYSNEWSLSKSLSVILGSSFSVAGSPLAVLLNPVLAFSMFGAGIFGIIKAITNAAGTKSANSMLVQAGESFKNNKLIGNKTEQYEIDKNNTTLPDLSYLLQRQIMSAKVNNIDADNLFTAENYLEMLKTQVLDKSSFNKKINDKGDTLLTQFFDVVPDEKGTAYKEILNTLKQIDGLDYNQKGALGVSCLEKIMNSENAQVLPLVKNFEFNYTPELDFAYQNITNQDFKNKLSKLNIRFNDILEAVKLQSFDSLNQLETQLDSPLCDRKRLEKEINMILKSVNDKSYEGYFRSIYPKYLNKSDSNLID